MKRIVCMQLLLLCVPRAQAMQDGQQIIKRIMLQSSDNQTFDISGKEARLFGTLKDMFIDTQDDESPIPVSMAGADLQAMVHDIPWIRKLHAAHNQNSDDIDKILQLDEKIRRERARQSAENIDEIPIYSAETLQTTIQRMRSASFLSALESVEKNAKIISELLVSKKFLRELHANPDNNSMQSVFLLPEGLQDAIHFYMPQHWGEHVNIKHDGSVRSVAFSPNGEWLATGSGDNNARIIEVATGVVKHAIKHNGSVWSVAFSSNGKLLATGSWDNNARIIDVATDVVKQTIKHGDWVRSVAFPPNSELLATGSDDKSARIHACLTNNFKNAVLASYLKSCQENEIQPNMRGWVSEAVQNHRYQKALKNAFPGLAIFGAEQSKWCAII